MVVRVVVVSKEVSMLVSGEVSMAVVGACSWGGASTSSTTAGALSCFLFLVYIGLGCNAEGHRAEYQNKLYKM